MKKTRSELKRAAILDAAKHAFLEFGVQNTSMDKLASLANVSKRTVYNHFSSKEELVVELVSTLWRDAVLDIDVEFRADESLTEQFAAVLLAEINVSCSEEYIEIAKVAVGHYFYSQDELKEQVSKMSKVESAITRWVTSAIEHGSFRECDIKFCTDQAYALIKGYYFWPLLMGMRGYPTEDEKRLYAQRTADLLLNFYKS